MHNLHNNLTNIRHNNFISKFSETQICEKYLFEWLQQALQQQQQAPALPSTRQWRTVHSYSKELGRMGLEPGGYRDIKFAIKGNNLLTILK